MASHRRRPAPVLTEVADSDDTRKEFFAAVVRGFHGDYNLEHWDFDQQVFEFDRCFGFNAGDRWVATCGAFTRVMTTPGGTVPVGAVTIVTVAPTHRRQGLLSAMMRHQLADVHRRKEPVALLWASEAGIYGRFGYGAAAPRLRVSGQTRSTAFRPEVDLGDGWIEEVSKEEFAAAVPALHARLLPQRPGALDRSGVFWERELLDRPEDRRGAPPIRYALHFAGAGLDGYARFKVSAPWAGEQPNGEVEILELDAVDIQARAGLWRFLLDLDLIRRFAVPAVAVDEPLRHLLADPRSLVSTLSDGTYVRIVDLPRALAARRFGADLDVVVRVSDPLLEHNDGAFRIQADAGGPARVTKAGRRRPDLSLEIRELGSIYLGGVSLDALHRAGLVAERTPGAVAATSRAFDWPTKPFCPDDF